MKSFEISGSQKQHQKKEDLILNGEETNFNSYRKTSRVFFHKFMMIQTSIQKTQIPSIVPRSNLLLFQIQFPFPKPSLLHPRFYLLLLFAFFFSWWSRRKPGVIPDFKRENNQNVPLVNSCTFNSVHLRKLLAQKIPQRPRHLSTRTVKLWLEKHRTLGSIVDRSKLSTKPPQNFWLWY